MSKELTMLQNAEILLTIKLQKQLFVDPKRIRLLKAIQECGSINQAAKNTHISYKSAWDHLAAMNEISPKPLLERNVGGKNGGGTTLTSYATRLLQLYDLLEQTQEKAFQVLHNEEVELSSALSATAKFSLQSSARNQFFGKVVKLNSQENTTFVNIQIDGLTQHMIAAITEKSAVKLGLVLGKEVMLMIKAPWVKLHQTQPHLTENLFLGDILSVSETPHIKETQIAVEGVEFCATIPSELPMAIGNKIWLSIDPEQIILATL